MHWVHLLSGRPAVRIRSGVPKRCDSNGSRRFFAFECVVSMAAAASEIQPLHLVWHPFFISNRFCIFRRLAPPWHHGTNQSFATLVRYERCKRTQEFGGLLELYDDTLHVQCSLWFIRRFHTAQIWVCVKRTFKLLCIDLAVFIENVSIYLCDHIGL